MFCQTFVTAVTLISWNTDTGIIFCANMFPSKRLQERVHLGDIAIFYYQIIAFKG
jgi:hypothetical protein